VKSNQGILGMAPALLFLVTGAFWVGILVTGGGVLLFWAALTCFVSGASLFAWSSFWATRPLAVATALFGLCLTLYQLYDSVSIGIGSIAVYSGVLFAVFTVIYVYLFFASLKKA
jgi:hypothetical protein